MFLCVYLVVYMYVNELDSRVIFLTSLSSSGKRHSHNKHLYGHHVCNDGSIYLRVYVCTLGVVTFLCPDIYVVDITSAINTQSSTICLCQKTHIQ